MACASLFAFSTMACRSNGPINPFFQTGSDAAASGFMENVEKQC